MTAERLKRIRLTKHARDKFEFLRRYGFDISERSIRGAVASPSRVDRRDDELLALKPLDREYAIRVVYKMANGNIVVLTFYPVKRERFNV